MIILVLLASFIPSVLLFFFLRSNRKEDPEYKKECSKSLLRGVLCAAILVPINLVLQLLWRLTGIGKAYPLLDQLFSAFILAATVEEMLKFLTSALTHAPAERNKHKGAIREDIIIISCQAVALQLNHQLAFAYFHF